MRQAPVLNGTFDVLTRAQAVEAVFDRIARRERGYLCTVNVAYLMMMRANPRLQRFVDRAALRVADGTPLVWASHVLGVPLPERVAGIDLMEDLVERASAEGLGVCLLGARPEVIAEAAAQLSRRHPGLDLCGAFHGHFGAGEAADVARTVRESGAQALFVGMGVPRQEHFLEEHWDKLGVTFAMGVGGSFDVVAGRLRRAPRLLQHVGLEWAFRLSQEPRRLFLRYLVTNFTFLALLARALLRR